MPLPNSWKHREADKSESADCHEKEGATSALPPTPVLHFCGWHSSLLHPILPFEPKKLDTTHDIDLVHLPHGFLGPSPGSGLRGGQSSERDLVLAAKDCQQPENRLYQNPSCFWPMSSTTLAITLFTKQQKQTQQQQMQQQQSFPSNAGHTSSQSLPSRHAGHQAAEAEAATAIVTAKLP
ncbi:hypothetical protein AK830_g12437 [Neonectria ditissima]|uniref:Uncharacterized protein n=1 Tax=Neonectria ditissima TaxID=78410 RepID=A0A0P7B0L1_9HYPO|nr:hypothetical protein AK830_g12437 [Neonectria ditissima]